MNTKYLCACLKRYANLSLKQGWHCARWVLSCLPPLFIEEEGCIFVHLLSSWRKEGLIFVHQFVGQQTPPLFMEESRTYICPPVCGTANKQDHCLILWSVRSLYHRGLLQDFLYPQPRNRKKCCHGNTCCLVLLKS